MTASDAREEAGAESLDLRGVRVLLVEDSWHLGIALKSQLRAFGADVAGPCATAAEAERMISEHRPDAALVDYNLRGGERADRLINLLHGQGVRVIVSSGYAVLPAVTAKAATVLQKPIVEAELIAALRPVTAQKAAQ